jgi:hypothetical protein
MPYEQEKILCKNAATNDSIGAKEEKKRNSI